MQKTKAHEMKKMQEFDGSVLLQEGYSERRIVRRKCLVFRGLSPVCTYLTRFFTIVFSKRGLIIRNLRRIGVDKRHFNAECGVRNVDLGRLSTGLIGEFKQWRGGRRMTKIGIDNEGAFGSVSGPSRDRVNRAARKENGLKMPRPCGRSGQNKIKYNPVFRGMVCPKYGTDF